VVEGVQARISEDERTTGLDRRALPGVEIDHPVGCAARPAGEDQGARQRRVSPLVAGVGQDELPHLPADERWVDGSALGPSVGEADLWTRRAPPRRREEDRAQREAAEERRWSQGSRTPARTRS